MMKKFCLLTISLCIAAAITVAPLTASAAERAGLTDYPDILSEPLEFEELLDYAVGEDSFAFADKNKIILWNFDELTTEYIFESPISALDYEDGNYYYSTGTSVYILPGTNNDLPGDLTTHDFTEPSEYRLGDYLYAYDDDNVFYVSHIPSRKQTEFKEYGNVKLYNETLYVVKNNELYKIIDDQIEKQSFIYSNFNLLTQILVGDAVDQLSRFSDKPQIVYIKEESNLTEFKLSDLNDDSLFYPVTEPRLKTNSNISGPALLLCETGNTYVVAIGEKTYLMNKNSSLGSFDIYSQQLENATVTVNAEDWAHSLPFMSNATRLFEISPTDDIKVIAFYSVESEPELAHDFYLIEKTLSDGTVVYGYVSTEFLNLEFPKFDEGGSTVLPDPDPHNDNYIRTVILVLIVIILILIAAGYITWVSTSGKKRPNDDDKQNSTDGNIPVNKT